MTRAQLLLVAHCHSAQRDADGVRRDGEAPERVAELVDHGVAVERATLQDVLACDGELLGFCGLKRVNADGTDLVGQFEVGWRLRESAWGQGIAKEAAIAALDLAFGRLGAPHVVALTVAGNAGSWGLMEKLGMSRRADLDFDDPRYGADLNPTIIYRIDAAEWAAARAAALA